MFCNKFSAALKTAWRSYDQFIDAHIDTALAFTQNLKKFLDSPTGDILTSLTGNIGAAIKAALEKALAEVIPALTIADTCKGCNTLADQLTCYVTNLKKQSPDLQDGMLIKLASSLAGALHGNQLKTALYDLYTQAKYTSGK